jgi:signal transduction histidine kinase
MTRERRVLVVDADRTFTAAVQAGLSLQGYRVCETTPELMISTMSEFQPDLVLWDIEARVAGQIAPEEIVARWPGLVFVAMAGRPDRRWTRKTVGCDPPAFINKADGVKAVMAVVRECFAARAVQAGSSTRGALALAQATEEVKRAKLEFLATVSHELRTPLNAIIGFSELMIRDARDKTSGATVRTYIEDIHASGRHLLEIINDILDFARAEAGKLILQEQEADVREVVDSVMRLLGPGIRGSGIEITQVLPDNLPRLWCDERKLKRVLRHLVSNAAKFTRPGGIIALEAAVSKDGLTISVRDSGIGIAEADVQRVFEPFVQAESSFSRHHEGAGLGLPLVKAMMEIHGGGLVLESEPGKGTTVRLRFPPQRVMGPDREGGSDAISPAA